MSEDRTKIVVAVLLIAVAAGAAQGCDPAGSLDNPEYSPYLDGYERWDVADAVIAFNQLDGQRERFSCHRELEAAQRAVRREEGGPVKAETTAPVKAFEACLQGFGKAASVDQTRIQAAVLSDWVNHNFLPEIQARIDAEVAAVRKRLDDAGCGGDECKALTVVDDLAMPRLGSAEPLAFAEALELCASESRGGLRPWRLPTKAELTKLLESGVVPSENAKAAYWSGERAFGDLGDVQAWLVRFEAAAEGGTRLQPELVAFMRKRLPVKAKVRCVHDLSGAAPAPTAVDTMEDAVVAAGCGRSTWTERVRLREKMLVMWQRFDASASELDGACEVIDWCGLSWSAPTSAQLEVLTADPWFGKTADRRCVAALPEP